MGASSSTPSRYEIAAAENALNALATPKMDIDSLVISVRDSINCIEPWTNARSDLPLVKNTLRNLQTEIRNYSSALRVSTVSANNGANFAQKAQQLCTFLMDRNTPEYQIRAHIREMKTIVVKAHRDAVQTSRNFRNSRTKMNQVAQSIPRDREELQRQQARQNRRYDEADERHSDAMTGAILKSIIFPIGIPWFVSDAIDTRRDARREMEDSQRVVAKCVAARRQLARIENGVGHMAGHIDELANWWVRVEAMLDRVNENVSNIQANKANRIRLQGMRTEWGNIRGKYLEYKTEVVRLRIT